jgi:glyoxylase-like metal-dependent hydrolase (beta-lactamase superfamily II)
MPVSRPSVPRPPVPKPSETVDGVTRIPLPIGIHGIESVNVYALADGDRVTLVDCGVWRAEPSGGPAGPDGSPHGDGLPALEKGLEAAGYALRDVSRIVVTHAHIDHYGLAGRLLELTGAGLYMHAMTDLDTEKYRHPDTAMARRRDMYADHGLTDPELGQLADSLRDWLPYLYSVVEASTRLRGGEHLVIGGRNWEVVHTPGHSYGHVCLWSPDTEVVFSGDHLLPGVTPPVTFERGFDADPLRSYLASLEEIAARAPALVLPGHGRPFGDCARRIEAIVRSKHRRLAAIRDVIRQRPRTVTEIADELFTRAVLRFQRNFALSEALAHIAYLRWSGEVERRVRPDGVYEWYAVGTREST